MSKKSNYSLSFSLVIFVFGLVGCDNTIEGHQSDSKRTKAEQNRTKGNVDKNKNDKGISDQNSVSFGATKIASADINQQTNRSDFIQNILNEGSPEAALAFLVLNQGKLTNEDNIVQSEWISKISNVSRSVLEQESQFVIAGLEGSLILKALASKILMTTDFGDLKKTARILTDTRTRFRFLVTFLGDAVQSEPARVLPSLNQLRDLNSQPNDVGWYNQLVADTVGKIPADKVEKTWEQMGAISDQSTRRIVAQKLLINYYNSDSFKASEWLDNIPNSDDKYYAVRALVQKLNASGDKESAVAWRDFLPENYRYSLD